MNHQAGSAGRAWFVASFLVLPASLSAQSDFTRGDANCNGCVNIVDIYTMGAVLFLGATLPCDCSETIDVNCDSEVSTTDLPALGNYLLGGAAPCAPFPGCGPSTTGVGCVSYPTCPLFKRGDANQDGCVSSMDAVFIADFLFMTGPAPACNLAADANDDDAVNTEDVAFILNYCNLGTTAPSAPGPFVCGDDPTPGTLACGSYPSSACCGGCLNQLPSDANQDGLVDISDPVFLLDFLFLGTVTALPCGDGTEEHPSNFKLVNCNGDTSFDISDPIYLLAYLFLGGPPAVAGTTCIYIEGCPQNPGCTACTP